RAGGGRGAEGPVVGKGRVVTVAERERRAADRRAYDLGRIERHGPERRPCRPGQGSAVNASRGLLRGCGQPQRRSVEVVREPRGEDDVALVREMEAPARFAG